MTTTTATAKAKNLISFPRKVRQHRPPPRHQTQRQETSHAGMITSKQVSLRTTKHRSERHYLIFTSISCGYDTRRCNFGGKPTACLVVRQLQAADVLRGRHTRACTQERSAGRTAQRVLVVASGNPRKRENNRRVDALLRAWDKRGNACSALPHVSHHASESSRESPHRGGGC